MTISYTYGIMLGTSIETWTEVLYFLFHNTVIELTTSLKKRKSI